MKLLARYRVHGGGAILGHRVHKLGEGFGRAVRGWSRREFCSTDVASGLTSKINRRIRGEAKKAAEHASCCLFTF